VIAQTINFVVVVMLGELAAASAAKFKVIIIVSTKQLSPSKICQHCWRFQSRHETANQFSWLPHIVVNYGRMAWIAQNWKLCEAINPK